MSLLFNVGAVVLLLGGLIFVHELGHFLVAKALSVKVVRFSIGFGPRLFGFTRGETEYQISLLPLGGYVKMTGEDPTQDVAPEDRGRGFLEQAPWKRLAISFAGPAMNLLFPGLLFVALGLAQNGELVAGPVVGTVAPGSPAEVAGLQPGDRIRSVTVPGRPALALRWFSDLRDVVAPHPEAPLTFVVERGGTSLPLTIVPAAEDDSNLVERRTRGVIGVTPAYATALAAPAPGLESPLRPLDLVTSVAGREVRHAGDLAAALAAASCQPVAMAVRRGSGADRPALALQAVPTCLPGGGPAVLPADPTVAAYLARVDAGSPAAAAGLVRGDRLTAVNGHPVRSFRDVNALGREFKPGVPALLSLGDGRVVTLTPEGEAFRDKQTREEGTRPVLGFHLEDRVGLEVAGLLVEEVTLHRGVGEIAGLATQQLWEVVRLTVLGLGKLFTGDISLKTVGGPIMIFSIAAEAAEAGLGTYLFQMALISVNLGLMNLLPIPVLDGGHIVTAALEGITRRRLSLRTRELANWVGLALLLTLMVFAFGNDLMWLRG
ncbi:MAG: site-2 protease family protein [Anaeromyxobacter sp.]|nr:site-2 protease family protein [Anaeromyxobacter sp.]MBL0276523.1 site-2 protease family protein [Anaeromyxobacter sp.]